MEVDLSENSIVFYPRWSGKKLSYDTGRCIDEEHGGADPVLVGSFLNAIKNKDLPKASLIDGLWATAVSLAAEKSRQSKKTVYLDKIIDVKSKLLKK